MALSYDLISQFAKLTANDKKTGSESTVYGTVRVDEHGNKYVQLDGTDQLTPLTEDDDPKTESTTTNTNDGERVSVLIKNHTATVTGNISSPAARTGDVKDLDDKVTDVQKFGILVGEKVDANSAYFKSLIANDAIIEELEAGKISVVDLIAKNAEIKDLIAGKATITDLIAKKIDTDIISADTAIIDKLKAGEIDVLSLIADKAVVEQLIANKADLKSLIAEEADVKFANIDFANIGEAAVKKIFAESGIIRELAVGEQYITGELVGVTIKGDLIEGNTIKADKLVVKGEDGLYYALNYSGGALTGDKISDAIYYAVTYDEESGNYIPGEDPINALQGTLVEGVVTTDNREVYSLTNASGETIYYCLDTEWSKEKLHGSVIAAKSITATKIRVEDLVAFGATIGGFKITEDAIYSGVKESVDNSTTGVYMDNEGQIAIGDTDNHIKYYKDNDSYKLDIAAESITTQIKSATESFGEAAENISKHFSFNDDGLTISSGKNQMSIRIDNDIIIFEKNGEEFGWWDGVNFNTGNIMVNLNERAQFGNFAFVPRSDGSMSFLKVANNSGVYAMMSPSRIMTLYGIIPTLDETTLLISEGYGELDGTTLIVGGE